MLDIFSHIYDTIFPPHESIKKLRAETNEDFVRFFSPQRFVNCLSLSDFGNPVVKAAITANKFYDYNKASDLLSVLVEHWLNTIPPVPTIFIPIPLSTARQKERGYNQVTRILEKVEFEDIQILDLIKREKNTLPQTSLSREKRFENVAGVFVLREDIKTEFSGKRIVIVDDVVTTGATMHAAYSSISTYLPKDSEVICLAIAH